MGAADHVRFNPFEREHEAESCEGSHEGQEFHVVRPPSSPRRGGFVQPLPATPQTKSPPQFRGAAVNGPGGAGCGALGKPTPTPSKVIPDEEIVTKDAGPAGGHGAHGCHRARDRGLSQRQAKAAGTVAVTGTLADGTGAVNGVLDVERFATQNGTLTAIGTFAGTITDDADTVLASTDGTQLALPVNVQQSEGSCQILHLVLGPLNL